MRLIELIPLLHTTLNDARCFCLGRNIRQSEIFSLLIDLIILKNKPEESDLISYRSNQRQLIFVDVLFSIVFVLFHASCI